MATVKYKDPASGTWGDIGGQGPSGDQGVIGPEGPIGEIGPIGPTGDEVTRGPDVPATPTTELWYDTDAPHPFTPSEMPAGGTTGQSAVKLSDADFVVGWDGFYLPLSGGTVSGDLAINEAASTATLVAPDVVGDVWFNNDITAHLVEDRSEYAWEQHDVTPTLVGNWNSDLSIGPCKAWRNSYMVLVNLCLGSDPEIAQEVWLDIATLPVGWRPAVELWATAPSVDVRSDGPTTENRILADGRIQLRGKALNSPDPQTTTRMCIYHCYPRSDF